MKIGRLISGEVLGVVRRSAGEPNAAHRDNEIDGEDEVVDLVSQLSGHPEKGGLDLIVLAPTLNNSEYEMGLATSLELLHTFRPRGRQLLRRLWSSWQL